MPEGITAPQRSDTTQLPTPSDAPQPLLERLETFGQRTRDLNGQRRTTGGRVPVVDGFRGLAVAWILLGHCFNALGGNLAVDRGPLRHLFLSSYMGVDMLFIASGFVLFLPVVTNGTLGDMRSYARRRAARVVPAFYVFLAVSFFVAMIVSAPRGGAGAWVSHLLFLHAESHNAAEEVGFGVNGVLWTMSTEVMFYVALAGVARWYRRRPAAGLAIAVLIAQAWQLATVKLPEILRALGIDWAEVIEGQRRMALAFPTYTAHFAIGMTAAWLYVRFKERSVEPGRVIVFQLLVLAAIAFNVYQRVWEAKVAETAGPFDHHVRTIDRAFLFGCFILATALAPPAARWLFEAPLSRILGAVAYGTYLSHLPLIALLVASDGFSASTTDNGQLARLIAIVLPASVIMGIVSFRYLEEPFRRWARRARS